MKHNLTHRLSALFALLLFLAGGLQAQRSISGTVTGDDGSPLIGVSILVGGTASGTVTDVDGNYSLTAETGDKLIFSYTGYTTQQVTVGNSDDLNVTLKGGNDLE